MDLDNQLIQTVDWLSSVSGSVVLCLLFVMMIVIKSGPTVMVFEVLDPSNMISIQTVRMNQTHFHSVRVDFFCDWKGFCFRHESPIVETVYSWFVGVDRSYDFIQIEPVVISVKGFSTLHDARHSPNHFGKGIEYKLLTTCWCIGRQIWDPGKSSLQRSNISVKEKIPCVINRQRCVGCYQKRPPRKPPWNQPTTEDGDAIMMRIRRSDQQQVWVYATITKLHISFFTRVPKSRVLRCNGWIADFDFRKRKRWCIDKKKMFPKLESHTRLTDTTKATKHIIRIAALELFCFFVTNLFDCVHTLMV
ncbi:unnamed protein product [Arabidopsis arenosa]|uniref:Uncharacterized protein n=1 Tax=Arabidopsis arenosa TaxID=38785 RepID=A0A8S1ZH31_ARAAE|nr:unnamed protein product [Arabidopsis arenosa]